jgi:hypothetical protein
MHFIGSIYATHPYISTLVSYWVLSAFIGALPAPSATASGLYLFFFKFSNSLGGNLLRALSTQVEKSPNFQDAVNNLPGPVNKPVVIVEPAKP